MTLMQEMREVVS